MKKSLLTTLLLLAGSAAHANLICESANGNTLALSHGAIQSEIFKETAEAEAILTEANGLQTAFAGTLTVLSTRAGTAEFYDLVDPAGQKASVSIQKQFIPLPFPDNCQMTRAGCIDTFKSELKAHLNYLGASDVFTCQVAH
jgi:hypothetical protein